MIGSASPPPACCLGWARENLPGVVVGLRPPRIPGKLSSDRAKMASDDKVPRFRGYIVAYTPQKHRIYITYIGFGAICGGNVTPTYEDLFL